jgi:excisionase family DNA binding protein
VGTREAPHEKEWTMSAAEQLEVVSQAEEKVGIEDAAKIVGVSIHTLYKKAAARIIPSYKPGKELQFKVTDLVAYVESTRRGGKR